MPSREFNAPPTNIAIRQQENVVPQATKPPEAIPDVEEPKHNIEIKTSRDVKNDIDVDKELVNDEVKVETDKTELLLSEKELRKIEKAKRKEEKRKRKEEKRARKEREKLEKTDSELKKMVVPVGYRQTGINNINDPHGDEEIADKSVPSVSFQLGDNTKVKPGELGESGKWGKETSKATSALKKSGTDDHWNIADYNDEETVNLPIQSPRYRNTLAPFADSDDEREFYQEKKEVN